MASPSRSPSPSLRRPLTYPLVTKTRSTGIRRRHSLVALLRRIKIKLRPAKSQFFPPNRRRSQATQNGPSRPSISQPMAVEVISVKDFSRRQQLDKDNRAASINDTHTTPATPSLVVVPTPRPGSNSVEGRHGLRNKIHHIKNNSRNGSIAMSPTSCHSRVKDENKAPEVSLVSEPPSPTTTGGKSGSKKVPRLSHSKETLSFREGFDSSSFVSESKSGKQSLSHVDLSPAADDQASDASSVETRPDKYKSVAPVHALFDFEKAGQGFGPRVSVISRLNTPRCHISNMTSDDNEEASRGPSIVTPTSGSDVDEETKRMHSVSYPSPEGSISSLTTRPPTKLAPLNTKLSPSPSPRVATSATAPSETPTMTNATISRMPPSPVGVSPSSMVPCTPTDLDIHPALRSSGWNSASSACTVTTSPISMKESTQPDSSIAEAARDWKLFLAAAENGERRVRQTHWRGRSFGHNSENGCESIGAVLDAATQSSGRISGPLTRRGTAPEFTDTSDCPWSLDCGPESPSSSRSVASSRTVIRGELGDPWSSTQSSDLHRRGAVRGKHCRRSSGSPSHKTDFAKNRTARISLGAIGVGGPRKRVLPTLSLDLASDDSYHSRRTTSIIDTTREYGDNSCDQLSPSATSDCPTRLAPSPFPEAAPAVPLEVTGVEGSGTQWGSSCRYTTRIESTISDKSSKRRKSSLSQNLFESVRLSRNRTHDTTENAPRRSRFLEGFGEDNSR